MFRLTKLQAGWPISFRLDATVEPGAPGRLISLHFEDSDNSTVWVERTPEGYTAHRDETVFISKLLVAEGTICLLYTSPSPRDQRGSRMPSSA